MTHSINTKPNRHRMTQKALRGFTLIELMLSTAILTLVIGLAYAFWRFFTGGYTFSFNESRSAFEAETTLAQVVRELRQVQEAENGAYALEQVDDTELIFYADEDDDGEVERVRYWLEGAEFKRGVVEPQGDPVSYNSVDEEVRVISDTVLNDISEPVFYYYNEDWPEDTINNPLPLAQRQLATRYMRIFLRLKGSEGSDVPEVTVESGVALRTLKSNF